jgi:hypothetical protein
MRTRTRLAPWFVPWFAPRLAPAALALVAAVTLAGAPARAAPGKARSAPAHPDVPADPAVECADCHRDATPAIVAAWEGSPHGVALVKCLVCHRTTGAEFTRAPAPDRCRGCHAAELASVRPARGAPRSCFACHDPHTLRADAAKGRPHAR